MSEGALNIDQYTKILHSRTYSLSARLMSPGGFAALVDFDYIWAKATHYGKTEITAIPFTHSRAPRFTDPDAFNRGRAELLDHGLIAAVDARNGLYKPSEQYRTYTPTMRETSKMEARQREQDRAKARLKTLHEKQQQRRVQGVKHPLPNNDMCGGGNTPATTDHVEGVKCRPCGGGKNRGQWRGLNTPPCIIKNDQELLNPPPASSEKSGIGTPEGAEGAEASPFFKTHPEAAKVWNLYFPSKRKKYTGQKREQLWQEFVEAWKKANPGNEPAITEKIATALEKDMAKAGDPYDFPAPHRWLYEWHERRGQHAGEDDDLNFDCNVRSRPLSRSVEEILKSCPATQRMVEVSPNFRAAEWRAIGFVLCEHLNRNLDADTLKNLKTALSEYSGDFLPCLLGPKTLNRQYRVIKHEWDYSDLSGEELFCEVLAVMRNLLEATGKVATA